MSTGPAGPPPLDPADAGAVLAADVALVDALIEVPSPVDTPVAPVPPSPEPRVADADALTALADAVDGPGKDGRIDDAEEPDEEGEDGVEDVDRPARAAPDDDVDDDRPPAPASTDCGTDTSGLGRVKPHVRTAAEFLACRYGQPTMAGVAGRGGPSDHPRGLAVDFMVDRATGDALAACALENSHALGINYVIWRQRMNHGSGWTGMEDRGGATANHFDHVHISFREDAGDASLSGC